MRSYFMVHLASVAFLAVSVVAQTITTTDDLGQTIVEVITLDQLGLPTTQIISTVTSDDDVPGAATSLTSATSTGTSALTTPVLSTPTLSTPILSTPTSTSTTPTPQTVATTAADGQQGPVGAPPTTTDAGPTVYTYTTTDANGDTIAVVDTFTATFPTTVPFTPQSTGTILNYSQWLSIYGSGSTASAVSDTAAQSGSAQQFGLTRSCLGIAAGVLAGLLGGAWLVIF